MKKLIFTSAHKIVSHGSMEIPSRVSVNEEGGEERIQEGREGERANILHALLVQHTLMRASDRVRPSTQAQNNGRRSKGAYIKYVFA